MADIGTGATVSGANLPATYNIVSITHGDMSVEQIATSHLGTTGGMTFLRGDLFDPGTLEVEVQMDTEDPLTNDIPLTNVAADLVLTFPLASGDTSGATMTASATLQSASMNFPLEDLVTATLTFKLSGAVTWVDAT